MCLATCRTVSYTHKFVNVAPESSKITQFNNNWRFWNGKISKNSLFLENSSNYDLFFFIIKEYFLSFMFIPLFSNFSFIFRAWSFSDKRKKQLWQWSWSQRWHGFNGWTQTNILRTFLQMHTYRKPSQETLHSNHFEPVIISLY